MGQHTTFPPSSNLILYDLKDELDLVLLKLKLRKNDYLTRLVFLLENDLDFYREFFNEWLAYIVVVYNYGDENYEYDILDRLESYLINELSAVSDKLLHPEDITTEMEMVLTKVIFDDYLDQGTNVISDFIDDLTTVIANSSYLGGRPITEMGLNRIGYMGRTEVIIQV